MNKVNTGSPKGISKKSKIQEHTFRSIEERDAFYRFWEKKQTGQIKFRSSGEYIGDNENLFIAGKTISIHNKG